MTCFGQKNVSGYDANRSLKKCLHVLGFALALLWLWEHALARMLKDETQTIEPSCPGAPAKVNLKQTSASWLTDMSMSQIIKNPD